MSREHPCRLDTRIVFHHLLLLLKCLPILVATAFTAEQSCFFCHGSKFSSTGYLSISKIGTYLGHPWIKPGIYGRRTRPVRGGFYEELMALRELKVFNGNTHDRLRDLIAKGRKEVPVFERIWQLGDNLFQQANSLESFQVYLDSLLNPYLSLSFDPQEELLFESTSSIRVGKVLFIFGGYDARIQSQFTFSNMNRIPSGFKGVFQHRIESKGNQRSSTSDIILSSLGRLESFAVREGSPSAGTLNLAGFLMRSLPGDDFQFRSSKIIHLGKHRGLSIDQVKMMITFQVGSFISGSSGEPILELDFDLRQAMDKASSFQCFGRGKVYLRMDGIVEKLTSATKFSVRLLGLPIVKGISKDSIYLVD